MAYLYNYANQPWKTQARVRQIMDNFYQPTPDGLIGNEDCGQMSAWFVLSAAGFYPVTPGAPIYAIGSPLFPQVRFNLENGKSFVIKARACFEEQPLHSISNAEPTALHEVFHYAQGPDERRRIDF